MRGGCSGRAASWSSTGSTVPRTPPRWTSRGGTSTRDARIPYPFFTTYCDADSLAEFGAEFEAFIRHVNRPPSWANLEQPGTPVPMGLRLRRMLGGGPRGHLTRATYLEALREALGRVGKHLVEPDTLGACFKVIFRDARYLYPLTGKFHLHLLTVLRPVGK